MDDLLDTLHEVLNGLTVRAWRLHLSTPGVQATAPMLRGVWGAALRDIDRPLYRALFEGGDDGPPRYLVRPAGPEARPAPALEFFLFGPSWPAEESPVWMAWDEALARGLGPQRHPAHLVEVRPLAWDGTPLASGRRQPGFRLHPLPWPAGDPRHPCVLQFPAPLRLIRDGRLILEPTLPDVVLACLRRLRGHGGVAATRLWQQRHRWLDVARERPAGPWRGRPLDLVRYSARQGREVDLHGVTGCLPLPLGPGPLLDLLAAAPWLHLGKGTVLGLGQVLIEPDFTRQD